MLISKTIGEITHNKSIDVEEGDRLYLNIKVKEGYLVNSSVDIENANFRVIDTEDQTNRIQSVSQSENKVVLNQINKEESIILDIPVQVDVGSNFNVNDLNKRAQITLRGTYINNKGKEVKLEKTIEVNTNIDGTAENEIETEILKYVSFNVNGTKGTILQTSITSKLKENKLPVKTNKLEIEIPIINKSEPKTIALFAKSSMATNGKTSKVFSKEEYKYEDGKVTLEIANDDETLSWIKDSNDEIILTCVYDEELVNTNAEINLNAKSTITYYAKELKTATAETSIQRNLKSQVGEIVNASLDLSKDTIYKGYMLKESEKNTEFVDTINLNIGYSELIDAVTLKDEVSYILNKKEYKSNAIYTYSKVEKENIVEILGEDGYIKVFDENGNQLSTLNKDNLEIKYENEVSNLKFETSKPIAEGIISIENGREVKPLEYNKEQIEKFESIKVKVSSEIMKSGTVIIKGEESKEIKLENTSSQAELAISKQNLSTVQTNENVELRVTLKTNDESTSLYKNPKVELEFPSYIKGLNVETVKLLYEKELNIKEAFLDKNEKGNYIIDIELNGEQSKYNESGLTDGATLIMNSDILVDELTPKKSENLVLTVENENKNEVITVNSEVDFIAPSGIATVNKISEFNMDNDIATSISGKEGIGKIATKSIARTAKVEISATNNYEEQSKNVSILGRIPFEGNKSIKNKENLGSTFTTTLKSPITATGDTPTENIKIYYSENGDAEKGTNIDPNVWKDSYEDLKDVKSYLIVMPESYIFEKGASLSFTYNIEIPADLSTNESAFGTFAVYSSKVVEEAPLHEEVNEATKVGVTTGEGLNLETSLSADVENGAEVEEYSFIKYTASVKNNAKVSVKDVKVIVDVPTGSYYATYDETSKQYVIDFATNLRTLELAIDSIPAGETKTVEFVLRAPAFVDVNNLPQIEEHYYDEEGNEIPKEEIDHGNDYDYSNVEGFNKFKINIKATAEGYDDEFLSNEWENTIIAKKEDEEIKKIINIKASTDYNLEYFKVGSKVIYIVDVLNSQENELNNVIVKSKLPEGMTFKEANKNGKYNSDDRTITWNIEKLKAETLLLTVEFDKLPDGEYEKELPIKFTATCDENEETFESNTVTAKVASEHLNLSQTSNISDGYLSANEEITYTITVKNLGVVGATVTLTDIIPKELSLIKAYYMLDGKEVSVTRKNGNNVNFLLSLAEGETITVYVKAKAMEVPENVQVTNKISLSSKDIGEIEGNSITHTLIGKNGTGGSGEHPGGTGDNPGGLTGEYRLSGTAWVDNNKNGIREEGENLLTGLKVYLLNSNTREILSTAITNDNGGYVFLNLTSGNYVVVFEYDTNKYELTTYQINGSDDSVNSDAINMELTLNGVSKKYGATNTI